MDTCIMKMDICSSGLRGSLKAAIFMGSNPIVFISFTQYTFKPEQPEE